MPGRRPPPGLGRLGHHPTTPRSARGRGPRAILVGQQKIDRNPLLIKGLRFYFLTKNPKGSNLGSFVANNVARFLPKMGFDEGGALANRLFNRRSHWVSPTKGFRKNVEVQKQEE